MIISAYMVPHPPAAIPEIGGDEVKKMQATENSYGILAQKILKDRPDTIVIISPHATMYSDYFNISSGERAYGDFGKYRHPEISFDQKYDSAFTEELSKRCARAGFPAGMEYDREKMLDQGTMVPLYFIEQAYTDFQLVRIGLSGLSLRMHYELGEYIRDTAESLNCRVTIVASGDLSHCQKAGGPYGLHKEGPIYDEKIMKTMSNASFQELLEYDPEFLNRAEECGHRSFCIMAGTMDCLQVKSEVLSHEAPFGVGYGFVCYIPGAADNSRCIMKNYLKDSARAIEKKRNAADVYASFAIQAVQCAVCTHHPYRVPENAPAVLTEESAGVFVTIHEDSQLRGCIGTILPAKKNIAQEIAANAYSAALRDPRFQPIEEMALPYLDISVDILSKPEKIKSAEELDLKRYGVICSTADGRRGLLLPDLDNVESISEQIRIACRKGNIDPGEPFTMERFEAIRHV
jgi:AmmeMemoRadiSam system protein A/AmmeMemoRadiSam system protein B